jgi:rod shape-determining protein MreC
VARLRVRPDHVILTACIGLYIASAAQVRTARGTALAVGVTTLSTPILLLANLAGQAWDDFWEGRRSLSLALAELGRLREEASDLKRTNQLLTAEVATLRQGSKLLAAFPTFADHAVLARIVARDVLGLHTLRLDRGTVDGVKVDSPVLSADGLLGRVDRVQDHACRVQLLTHPAAAAAARVAGTQLEALLMGGDQPRLSGLPPYTQVPQGSPVVSTGSEGIYPAGLIFGTTLEARNDGLFTVVPIELAARAVDVGVVLVLPPVGRPPR